MSIRSMISKFNGTCKRCNSKTRKGETTIYQMGHIWVCETCKDILSSEENTSMKDEWDKFLPSYYQSNIWRHFDNTEDHIMIEALAGSGKSTTIRWLAYLASQNVKPNAVFLAFNKKIADDLRDRLPSNFQARTLNSLGYEIVRKYLGGRVQVRTDKLWNILTDYFPFKGEDEAVNKANRNLVFAAKKIIGLLKGTMTEATDENIVGLIAHHNLDVDSDMLPHILGAIPGIMEKCKAIALNDKVIDFDDQIWLVNLLNLPTMKYDLVFVDESQDLNQAQIDMIMRLISNGGRVVAVGDRAQSIYGFRGADHEAIPNLIARLGSSGRNVESLPLNVCYRCPTSALELAQQYVPQIEARENAPEGEVYEDKTENVINSLTNEDEQAEKAVDIKTMALCRINAHLVGPVYSLLRRGVKAIIYGRSVGDGLISMINRVNPKENDDMPTFAFHLEEYADKEIKKLQASGRSTAAFEDKIETTMAFMDGVFSVAKLIDNIDKIFTDDNRGTGIVFSTVHRAKGLESDKVILLQPKLFNYFGKQEWEVIQERNITYVALTRTKHTLIYAIGDMKSKAPERGENVPTNPQRKEIIVKETPVVNKAKAEVVCKPEFVSKMTGPLPNYSDNGGGTFVPPTKEDWEKIAEDYRKSGIYAEIVVPNGWKQYALMLGCPNGSLIRISTTVDIRGTAARNLGENGIDIVLVSDMNSRPLGGKKRVNRTGGWMGRMAARANQFILSR
jgi:superfamily I DNA/RNA helicase